MNPTLSDAPRLESSGTQPTFELPPADLAELLSQPSAAPIDKARLLSRCLGNQTFALLLLDEFQTSTPARIAELTRHFANSEAAELKVVAHSLKGIAATMTAVRLQKLSSDIETAVSEDWSQIANLLESLQRESQLCLDEVSRIRAQWQGASSSNEP